MRNAVYPIAVSPADHVELERLQRAPSTAAGLSRRAWAILLMAQGHSGGRNRRANWVHGVQVSPDSSAVCRARRGRAGRSPEGGTLTTDPLAAEKIHDVVGLSLDPPTTAAVLSVDEKTQIQALRRPEPLLPLRSDLPARQTYDYRRNGSTSLYAAFEVATGAIVGRRRPQHTGADFAAFLNRVARTYRTRERYVILDDSSTRSTPAVHE